MTDGAPAAAGTARAERCQDGAVTEPVASSVLSDGTIRRLVEGGRIARVTTYYTLTDWIRQVSA